jgi:hypothetical protein
MQVRCIDRLNLSRVIYNVHFGPVWPIKAGDVETDEDQNKAAFVAGPRSLKEYFFRQDTV